MCSLPKVNKYFRYLLCAMTLGIEGGTKGDMDLVLRYRIG